MTRDAATLLKEALALSAEDRAALAEALLASLGDDVTHAPEGAWATEIERRITELEAGTVSTIPLSEVRRGLFDRARSRSLKRLSDGLDLQWTPESSRDGLHRR
jgi:putative addiction module component (TIGR02574 family)